MAADELYGLPLAEFTAARDALAKQLRTAGDAEEAARVKRLVKPSLTAWALDRASRSHPQLVAGLMEAGARLREAQREALSGEASRLRETSRDVAEAVDRVADQAAEALRGAGREPGASHLERIRATLRAAAADPELGELLRRGVLVADAEPAGFGLAGFEEAAAAGVGRRERRPPAARAEEADKAVEAARRELRRAQAEADAAAGRARRRAERAEAVERRAQEARAEADTAREEAEEAAGEADVARRRAEEVARRLSEAEEAKKT